jgi:molybdopterin-containing oxidoreductase family iron-sulfur binding subunit
MAASIALANGIGCTRMPYEKIIPYVIAPEQLLPGQPMYYSSFFSLDGYAKGIHAESHEGRPTKIEGNSLHPASLGATDVFMQAAVLSLYDPDRSRNVTHLGRISSWDAFLLKVARELPEWRQKKGAGFRILSGNITSPSLAAQLQAFLDAFPLARWHQYEPLQQGNSKQGLKGLFGQQLRPIYRLARAKVIISLDEDFLGPGPAQQTYSRAFIERRKLREPRGSSASTAGFNRLYMAESSISLTGAFADHRLALAPDRVPDVALALAAEIGVPVKPPVSKSPSPLSEPQLHWIAHAAADLLAHPGESLVISGEHQSPLLHQLAALLNDKLKNIGNTVDFIQPPEIAPRSNIQSLSELTTQMEQGQVDTLLILGANPSYASSPELRFEERLSRVRLRIRLGQYEDETSSSCHWHLPEAHFLEKWGDGRAFDGTVSFQQPLIAPLYQGKSASEVLAFFLGQTGMNSYQLLQQYWRKERAALSEEEFQAFFKKCIHDGILESSAAPPVKPAFQSTALWPLPRSPLQAAGGLQLSFRPDPTIWDGQFANNGWLQELPKPLTQLTWDNAALISPATAQRLQLEDEDLVSIEIHKRQVQAPVLIVPGHPDETVTLHLGYGRTHAGSVGSGRGFNAYLLLGADQSLAVAGATLTKLHKKYELATTHAHDRMAHDQMAHDPMKGRAPVRAGTLEEYIKDPDQIVPDEARTHAQPSLLAGAPQPARNMPGEAWAMVIDLNTCIGCKACTIACQAENNIPIVGKEQVRRSREMHWIRVDRYYGHDERSPENPRVFFQPVPCMHCENAPCEVVCPTAATNHSHDGLNQMVYNRCVGTRYCSNNCPYKVRRFNFFEYADFKTTSYKLQWNPEVTVRSRGVMEKCTYCIQRIQRVRIQAEIEKRPIRDGEIIPACQAACPTDAIIFGNRNDPGSRVARLEKTKLNYSLLNELGTRPRTTYLAKISNLGPLSTGGGYK